MIKRWMQLKTWKKWVLGFISTIIVLLLCAVGYFYYRVKTVDLDEIIAKHQASASSEPTSTAQGQDVPSFLDKPLEKANSLTTKPIKADDAIDAAAILMNSGLSLKQMEYLTGKSTENLSNEEKQKIRDLLLKTLTSKEIEALRSITSQYGKYLAILDSNYPIELVGVYDENERARITKELEEKKKAGEYPSNSQVPSSSSPSPSPTPSPEGSKQPTLNSSQATEKKKIDAAYQGKFGDLQKSCQAKVSSLTDEVIKYIEQESDSGKEVTVTDLQGKFLSEIASAESNCDQQFNDILAKAKQDYKTKGIDLSSMPTYEAQYNDGKKKARSDALKQIVAKWQAASKN